MSIDVGQLPADLADFVEKEVRSGHYSSVNDVVCIAIGLLRDRATEVAELRRLIDEGYADYERGDYIEVKDQAAHDALFDEMKAELLASIQQDNRQP